MEQYGKQVFEEARPAQDGPRGRDSLLLMARVRTPDNGGAPVAVRVRNLSAGGLMAELPQSFSHDGPIEIEVRGIGWVPGRIAWQTEGRAGIAFDREIDPQLARKPVGRQATPRTRKFGAPKAR